MTVETQEMEAIDSLLAALARGESLPAHWYTDPAITAQEIQKVFRKTWNYIGPANELANPGDYITGYAGEVPVVVIRNEEGLAGFINVCRHRRHEVMKGRGNSKRMQCGYHAWTYDLTGCLKGAPRSASEPNFRLEDYPLLPLRVETLDRFVFVNLDSQANSLASYYGGVLDIIAGSGIQLESLKLYSREEWTAEANWKTMLENYLECYHCAVAHPGFSAAIDVKEENYHLTMHGWFASQLGDVRKSALEGKTAVKIYDARGELAQAQYHLLWPNMTININPGFPNLSIDVWVPDGPNKTKGFSEQYFGEGVSEQFAQDLIAFNKQVGYEDDDLTNSVQRGLLGGIPDRGRFLTNSEHLCIHFQRLVVEALFAGSMAARPATSRPFLPVSTTISAMPTASAVAEGERNSWVELEVAKVEKECELIQSFYLRRVDGEPLHSWEPGQFLPIRVAIPGHAEPLVRTYSLSTRCNPEFYRLSIRRGEGASLVSQFLHANGGPGLRLHAMTPRGKFVLQGSSGPVVLVSGGVGITPMIAMTEHLVEEGRRTGVYRPIQFIHGARNGRMHAFGKRLVELAAQHPALSLHVCYSDPGPEDRIGVSHHSDGRIAMALLEKLCQAKDSDFYLCGPSQFITGLYSGLLTMGVASERIHYESFGGGAPLKIDLPRKPVEERDTGAVRVKFAASGVEATWSRGGGTLLELAEEVGLAPAFGCRSGICGTCKTNILAGAVDYLDEPLADLRQGEILLCCSAPRKNGYADGADVILNL